MISKDADVVIVGAGVSGLACAAHLEMAGYACHIVEASDDVGGRIRTDVVAGPGGTYLLDRGFQIWLTSYPEGRAMVDGAGLGLRAFVPGALSWNGAGGFDRLSDPRRDRSPGHVVRSALSGAATVADKFRAARVMLPLLSGDAEALLPGDAPEAREETRVAIPDARTGRVLTEVRRPSVPVAPDRRRLTTLEWLRGAGFSAKSIHRFWRPFLAGVFLESELSTAAGFGMYTLRMFATGEATLPRDGMGAIPRQMAGKLKRTRIEFGREAVMVSKGCVTMRDGSRVGGRAVVVATEDRAARRLLQLPPGPPGEHKATACMYFAAPVPPGALKGEPILALDGEGTGPVNTVVVPSLVQPSYAPPGRALVSLSTVGLPRCSDEELHRDALAQMRRWFGPEVDAWEHLRTYRIPWALPEASPAARGVWKQGSRVSPGVYRAGDGLDSPSSQGAMASARRAADAVKRDVG